MRERLLCQSEKITGVRIPATDFAAARAEYWKGLTLSINNPDVRISINRCWAACYSMRAGWVLLGSEDQALKYVNHLLTMCLILLAYL